MIFNSYNEFKSANFKPRVAIMGSGPAGVTIARELAARGVPVVILEAGSDEYSDESQDFYDGKSIGDPYFQLTQTRLRMLGGASNHWAGWCRLLDAHDFAAKSWIPESGWPIARTDLEPYLGKVREILDLPEFKADMPISDDIRWVQLIKSGAVNFGQKFRSELAKSKNIALVLNTYVTALNGDGTRITGARIWSAGKDAGILEAETYVPCTGGIENSRLLLWSNEVSNGGVVPHAQALGRYWMEHPQFKGGDIVITNAPDVEYDAAGEAFFSPSPQAMERLGIGNFGIRFIQTPYEGVKKLVADLACTAPTLAEWTAKQLDQRMRCAAQLHVAWEQPPIEANGIGLLVTARDHAGVPRVELTWKKGALGRKTFLEGVRLFGETCVAKDIGRVRVADWLRNGEDYPTDEELAGHHHMGGTRMGTDVTKSVVDANCKVHGMENLYVGGSSVFTTSGQCNPTTTITALAVRLGDHLAHRLTV